MTKHTDHLFQTVALSLTAVILGLYLFSGFVQPVLRTCATESPHAGQFPQSITMHYSHPMAKRITELTMEITPPLEGQFSWKGSTMVFTPRTGFDPETTYTIKQQGMQNLDGKRNETLQECSITTPKEQLLFIAGEGEYTGQLVSLADTHIQPITPGTLHVTTYHYHQESNRIWILAVDKTNLRPMIPMVEQQQLWIYDRSTEVLQLLATEGPALLFHSALHPFGTELYVYKALLADDGTLAESGLWAVRADGEWRSLENIELINEPFFVSPGGDGILGKDFLTREYYFYPFRSGGDPQALGPYTSFAGFYPEHSTGVFLYAHPEEGAQLYHWKPGMSPLLARGFDTLPHSVALGEVLEHVYYTSGETPLSSFIVEDEERGMEILHEFTDGMATIEHRMPNGRIWYVAEQATLPNPQDVRSYFEESLTGATLYRYNSLTGVLQSLPITGTQPNTL